MSDTKQGLVEQQAPTGTGALRVTGLGVRFGGATGDVWALRGVDLRAEPGTFTVIVGRSGSGKSTLLRALAGLQKPSEGSVEYGGGPLGPRRSELRYVFQDYGQSLFPWLTVGGNVGFGAEFGGVARADRADAVTAALAQVGLGHVEGKRLWELSGGMQQRVAIARAIASRPNVILMDEPFGAVDALSRTNLQDTILNVLSSTGTTVLFVTHDIDEAIYLGDRVVVMHPGGDVVLLDLPIDLPRPRSQIETRELPHFNEYRRALVAAVTEEPS